MASRPFLFSIAREHSSLVVRAFGSGISRLITFMLVVFGLAVSAAYSHADIHFDALPDEQITALAAQDQWRHLLHVRYHPYSLRTISQNDSDEFFLAPNGKYNPDAELRENLRAFLLTDQADNHSAQCRFPARYHWLKQRLPSLEFIDQPCSEFTKWRDEINAESLTLIFPASHINSPSSMYGHTLVRMDRLDPASSKLLAYSVNFAANADPTDNELKFSVKGLTGGYPGQASVMPYYVKTNEYQHMEYRDIWEYSLDFGSAEVDQFVRHVWEIKDTEFDYYFFDENCSYRLLGMLDAASSRADLADDFDLKAVPVDTIRALYDAGFVKQARYRPSAASEMESNAAQASEQERALAKRLVESEIVEAEIVEPDVQFDADSSGMDIDAALSGMNEDAQVRTLELAYSYARYLAVKKKQANPVLRKRTLAILSARSKLPKGDAFTRVRPPAFRDDQGHGTSRLMLGGGYVDEQWFGDLNWRIAYHDVMDPPKGFSPGAQIEMGEFQVRVGEDTGLQLRGLELVNVLSLSHATDFQSPMAWTVSAGLKRFLPTDSELFSELNYGFGRAFALPFGKRGRASIGDARWYALADITARADNQFDEGYQLSAGLRGGWLWQGIASQERIEFQWQPVALGDDTPRRQLTIEEAWAGFDDVQLRFAFTRQWASSQAVNEWNLHYVWYF